MAEAILAAGDADLVSMARPMLADPEFANKAREGRADEINVCIACNQACLDFIFSNRVASCLVNPKAGRELEFDVAPPVAKKRVAVVGAGPAGLACAVTAAERGHAVTLYEAEARIGGQLNLARNVPGKEEFDETLRYYQARMARLGVEIRLGVRPDAARWRRAASTRSSSPPVWRRARWIFPASIMRIARATSRSSRGVGRPGAVWR